MNGNRNLEGRIALVTGGASGIGAATAARLKDAGAIVVVGDLSVEDSLDNRGNISQAKLDVADVASVERCIGRIVADHGRLDCLVHSAGIARTISFLDTTPETFDQIIGVNVRGTFLVGQAAARAMRDSGGGAIVNVGSVSGVLGNALRIAYGTSKAAVHHLTKVMAVELGPFNIRVNVVAPGPVSTPMTDAMYTPNVRAEWLGRMPRNRFGTPDDVAAAAVFLLSDDADFITGQTMCVDGGFTIKGLGTEV
ncbi:glucose 1-dehydrogenase [Brucella intermedia]|uniref:SDR family NAD(P)-dependent oxidoreductase n=1 Tax=Brucella intermedia TaxID=94625 RepID=UPI003207EC74